jgi:hypothetical protein
MARPPTRFTIAAIASSSSDAESALGRIKGQAGPNAIVAVGARKGSAEEQ